jgi:hypothetical protein
MSSFDELQTQFDRYPRLCVFFLQFDRGQTALNKVSALPTGATAAIGVDIGGNRCSL